MKTVPVVRMMARLSFVVTLFIASLLAVAQADKYKPGDKIEYQESSFPELWEVGVYVGSTPEGKQPIIRKKPNQFYKDGSQTAYSWERIRPLAAKPAGKVLADAPTKTATLPPPAPVPTPAPKPVAPTPVVTTTPAAIGGGLLTKEDVLNFLQTRLGDQPFAHPQREQIKKELAALIKQRGLNFRYETLSDFSNALGKYGATSDITFPLRDNFGPPTPLPWYTGKWSLSKIGSTVDYRGNDGYIYRQTEIGVKDVGFIIITADNKYTWDIDVPKGVAKGAWRKATPEEMPSQGGDALVLLQAKGGLDWIVHQDRVTELKGDWVNVTQLHARQIREGGFRTGKGK